MEGLETKMAVQVKREVVADEEDEKEKEKEKEEEEEEVACVGVSAGKKGSVGGGGMLQCCQVEKCNADLHNEKQYYRRHKVCQFHTKAQVVLVAGMPQRFCQQCSRFHELAEFDDTKRSCRRRLAEHTERRRKNTMSQAEGSTGFPQLKDILGGNDRRLGGHHKRLIKNPESQAQGSTRIRSLGCLAGWPRSPSLSPPRSPSLSPPRSLSPPPPRS